MILKLRLKEILDKKGWTQARLAEETGLRPNTISEMSKNIRDSINREHVGKVAKALGITDPSDLFYFEEK